MNENNKAIRVGDIMRPRFIVMDGLDTVASAVNRMADENASVVIVDKRSPGDEYGLVLLTDIVTRVMAVNRSPQRVNLYEIMSKPVITVGHAMKVRYCARLFSNFRISSAPVMQDDKIVGIVSYRELAFAGMADDLADDGKTG